MINPSKIVEGGVEYSLGTFTGTEMIYDFPKILVYLEAKGRLLFGQKFKIIDEDHQTWYKLANYFIKDQEKCHKYNIDIHKGILLSGPVGCGKTSMMRLLKHLVPHQRPYEVIPARNIVFSFNLIGYKIIEDYGKSGLFCFDDLGIEPEGKFFGNDCNVMGELLLSRHDLFLNHKLKTHLTTNLNATELEERYGSRLRSRMRQAYNLIAFPKNAKDKRI
ncbi:ATPase [Salinimicrobium sp. TIG7-5_MAKvit]|uniref:ATPase n=1 Tax=Salinimicrobium sp. TIG7-5_MAKvit TaxID=3121289 RepID=UPI003C6DDCD1